MGELLGATAGAKETVSAQARHLSCVEERLASQLEAVQASVQVYQNKMGALEDALETSMNTIRGLTKHQALLTKLASEAEEESTLSSHQAQMQELALDLASRVTHLERMDRTLRASAMEEATLAEDAQMRLQLQELQASSQRLHKEMLDVVARIEEHSVHLASSRTRMEALEDQHPGPGAAVKTPSFQS